MIKKEKNLLEFVEAWKLEDEEKAWKLNSLPKEERNLILRKCDEHNMKIGSWRRFIPGYGIRYEYGGIDAHWTIPGRLAYHSVTCAAMIYGLIKLVESLK